jgi:GTP1/Obg family GTP-binding protein|tara:strand:+ start:206 stop:391 length:186 start_codon:yes stop_codon:yes gene_type:complete
MNLKINKLKVGTLVEVLSIYSIKRTRKGFVVGYLPRNKIRIQMLDTEAINDYSLDQIKRAQ